GLAFFYFGSILLTQVFPSSAASALTVTPEAISEEITEPLFEEEWEMFSAVSDGDGGGGHTVADSLFSALGKKSGAARRRSVDLRPDALPFDRVVKWFKREQDVTAM